MRWIVLLFLLPTWHICAQQSTTIPLDQSYVPTQLSVSANEQFRVSNGLNDVAIADALDGPWQVIQSIQRHSDSFEKSIFFNRDTGFLYGNISINDSKKFIYHTQNGGKTWTPINIGIDGEANNAWVLANGEAWICIRGKIFAYSKDYGLSWTLLPVYDERQFYHTIYFNPKHEGMIGSVWNSIAYTSNNCKPWKKLPTPLDQQAYRKTDLKRRPEIDKVSIYKDLLLVSEEGMIFYSKKDSIHWNYLPGYTNFSTDATNTALYFLTSKGQVVKTDETLLPQIVTKIPVKIKELFTRNGRLFIQSDSSILAVNNEGKLKQYFIRKPGPPDEDTVELHEAYTNKIYGAAGNKIFRQTKEEKWEYAFTLPFPVDRPKDIRIIKGQLSYESKDSVYFFNIRKQTNKATTTQAMLDEFRKHPVKQISFSTGYFNCDGSGEYAISYTRHKNEFVLSRIDTGKVQYASTKLKPEITGIPSKNIAKFVEGICLHYKRQPVLKDIVFSEADYQQCKQDIKRYQQYNLFNYPHVVGGPDTLFYFDQNNIDFDKLIACVDSVKNIDSTSLNQALSNIDSHIFNLHYWITVDLENDAGSKLTITNSYMNPNALYIPWKIYIDRSTVTTISSSPAILPFFQENCPSLLATHNKVPILHELVKYLYSWPSNNQ